ncbi:Ribosomal RNA small subunit methyltransferase G [Bienertia sinuspersici]
MEDQIVEINQKVNEMQLSEDEVKKMNEMLDDLPPIFSDGSCFRDFLRGLGFDPDDVLNPDNWCDWAGVAAMVGWAEVAVMLGWARRLGNCGGVWRVCNAAVGSSEVGKPSTPQSGYSLIPEGRSGCFRAIGPDAVKELVVPCADQALADFNCKHDTDYKLAEESYNDACLRAKANVGCYDVHCNFTAKAETKPL